MVKKSIYFDEADWERLRKLAEKEGEGMSIIIRRMLKAFFKEKK